MAGAKGGSGRRFVWLAFILALVALDQWTKGLAQAGLAYREPVAIAPFLNLTLAFNPGAAFSFLGDAGGWQRWFLSGVGVAVSAGLLVWLLRLPQTNGKALPLALALIIGGALGNVWDRIVLGVVVDFIDVHWKGWHWPAFNVADSAITIGAVLFIALSFRSEPPTGGSKSASQRSETS